MDSINTERQYALLAKQIASLIEGEHHPVSVLANVAAALHEAFAPRFFWTGFYLVEAGELILGPFQGPVACMHIGHGRGVCGTSWAEARTIVVDDVEQFPGHIACSSLSRSEIVVPFADAEGHIRGVLDIDSRQLAAFTCADRQGLEAIMRLVAGQLYPADAAPTA